MPPLPISPLYLSFPPNVTLQPLHFVADEEDLENDQDLGEEMSGSEDESEGDLSC